MLHLSYAIFAPALALAPRWPAVSSPRCLYPTSCTPISHEYFTDLFDLELPLECSNAADDVCNFSKSAVDAFAEGNEGAFDEESGEQAGGGGVEVLPEVVGGGAWVGEGYLWRG